MTPVTFDDVAGAYDTFIGRWTRAFLPALLRAARVERGQCVLDLATGTGESALMVHDAVGASGQVVGVDISLPMLRGAAAKVDRRRIGLAAMDGQALACRAASFDAVVCQLGLMFFPDPVAGARECRRALRPGGAFGSLVWAGAERVPWFGPLAAGLLEHFPQRRDEIVRGASLGEPGRLEHVLTAAGLRDVGVTAETQTIAFESFDDYWRLVETGAIRVGLLLRDLPDDAVHAIRARAHEALSRFESDGRLTVPTTALVGVGRS